MSETPNELYPPMDPNDVLSDTTDGGKPIAQVIIDEQDGGNADGYDLEADSEEEGDMTPDKHDDEYDEQEPTSLDENGNRRGPLTETGQEEESYSQDYEQYDEEYEVQSPDNDMYTEQFDQTGKTFEMQEAMRGQVNSSGAMISQSYMTTTTKQQKSSNLMGPEIPTEEAIGRINRQIDARQHRKVVVEPEEAVQILKSFANEKVPINNERLDMFFSSNKFLKQFKDQTDIVAVHELYKALTLKQYTTGQTVIRYGHTSDECFFLIKGKVEKMAPSKTSFEAKYEEDLVKFYAENYDSIIWEKVDEGEEMKKIVDMYLEDPDGLELERPRTKKEKSHKKMLHHETLPLAIPLECESIAKKICEELSRPGSAYSHRSNHSRIQQKDSQVSNTSVNWDAFRSKQQTAGQKSKPMHGTDLKSQLMMLEHNSELVNATDSIDQQSNATFTEDVWMFRCVGDIEPSQSFGQAALAQIKPSLITYQCAEDCEIVSLSKETCVRILEKAVKRDFQGRVQFLKSFRVLQEMSQNQLESLLYHLKLIHFDRGQTIFSVGDKPDGIYLIQDGSFELSKLGSMNDCQEKIVNAMKIDPMAKFQMRKQARVIKDNSRKMVKLAILGNGELFGLEECQSRLNSTNSKPKTRSYTVKCLENNSKLVFLSHQVLSEKVLYDPRLEQQVKYDCALKEFFHNSRELQHQQTVWNGALTSMRQIENAAEKADDDFDEALKRDTYGNINPDMKGLPKLRTVDQYMRQKFEAQILNTIMDRMQERAVESLAGEEQGIKDFVKSRMNEIESHFDHNINVINADRKEQKARKAHLKAMETMEKSRQEEAQHNLSIATSHEQTFMDSNTQFQDSLLSSHGNIRNSPRDFDYSQNIMIPPHFTSTDGKMKIVQSFVKQRVSDSGYEGLNAQGPHFVSADVEQVAHSVPYRQAGNIPIAEPSEMSHTGKTSPREILGRSNLGFTSYAGDNVPAQATTMLDGHSLIIDQKPTGSVTPTNGAVQHMMPPISGDRSDGAVFRGLNNSTEGSGGIIGSHSQMEKIKTDNQQQDVSDQERSLAGQTAGFQDPIYKTQQSFQNKERNLLDMFKEQTSDNEKSDRNKYQDGDANGAETPTPQDELTDGSKAKDGGIIVSHRSRQEFKAPSQLEQQNSTSNKNSMPPGIEMQMRELSETTGQPSHGPMSINRDPRYSQDKIRPPIGLGGKLLGLANTLKMPRGTDQHIKIPKVDLETEIPIYQEEERSAQGSPELQKSEVAPLINISTRVASKKQSRELLDDSISTQNELLKPQQQPGKVTEVISVPLSSDTGVHTPASVAEEKPTIYKTSGALDANELPFNQQYVSQSGLKGKKRNQLSFISKTIGEKSFKAKMRATVASMRDQTFAASSVPMDQQMMHTTMNESFTANMPELYTGAVHSQTVDASSVGPPRGTRAIHNNNNMFPNLTGGMGSNYMRQRDLGFTNADISMIDGGKYGPSQDVQRIMDKHQANNLKKEVFVPSQINPRMRRKAGKSLAMKQKLQQKVRGTSSHSFGTITVKSKTNQRNRSFSIGQKHSIQLGGTMSQKDSMNDYQQMPQQTMFSPLHVASTTDQPFSNIEQHPHSTMDETGNSFAKHMQNPNDTQYQTAIMREARQKQMILENSRAASQQSHQIDSLLMEQGEFQDGTSYTPLNLSPAASAAASELIQKFLARPNEPISTEAFLNVQKKYELPPFEAYQLLLQQIQFQKALLTPPTAATVIKVSHNSYTTAVRDKRDEVISFRNDLFRRYTYNNKRPTNEYLGGLTDMAQAAAAIQTSAQPSQPATAIKTARRSNKSK